jgi:hypothetical protein
VLTNESVKYPDELRERVAGSGVGQVDSRA